MSVEISFTADAVACAIVAAARTVGEDPTIVFDRVPLAVKPNVSRLRRNNYRILAGTLLMSEFSKIQATQIARVLAINSNNALLPSRRAAIPTGQRTRATKEFRRLLELHCRPFRWTTPDAKSPGGSAGQPVLAGRPATRPAVLDAHQVAMLSQPVFRDKESPAIQEARRRVAENPPKPPPLAPSVGISNARARTVGDIAVSVLREEIGRGAGGVNRAREAANATNRTIAKQTLEQALANTPGAVKIK